MLAIALASGADPRSAAWAIDTLSLYVVSYAMEASLAQARQKDPDSAWVLNRNELIRRVSRTVTPLLTRVPLADAAKVHAALEQRTTVGKTVLAAG